MARGRKDTANRPSQANQEFVRTKDGRRVRNLAYNPLRKRTGEEREIVPAAAGAGGGAFGAGAAAFAAGGATGGGLFIAGLAAGGGAGSAFGGGGAAAAAGFSVAPGFASSSAMMRRIDARISSIEGSWTFAGCVISDSTSKLFYIKPERIRRFR